MYAENTNESINLPQHEHAPIRTRLESNILREWTSLIGKYILYFI